MPLPPQTYRQSLRLLLVDRTEREWSEREWLGMLSLRHDEIWTPRIMRTLDTNAVGLPQLADADLRALALALQVESEV